MRSDTIRTLTALALLLAAPAAFAEDLSDYTGAELYMRFCASCHGLDGEGDGPVAAYFKVAPPSLTRMARREDGEFPKERVRRIIDGRMVPNPHGTRTMPVWGTEFLLVEGDTPEGRERAQLLVERLLLHVESLQKRDGAS